MLFSFRPQSVSVICLALLTSALTSSARIFTNNSGKKIDAKIVSVEGKSVKLRLHKNAKVYTIKISSLSAGDQKYIKQYVAKKKTTPDNKKKSQPSGPPTDFGYKSLKSKYDLKDNFDEKWPSLSSTRPPEVSIIQEDDSSRKFIYESENYRFTCDVKLSKNVVKKFAHLFEATRDFCKVLPISMLKAQLPDGATKYKILLFETKQTYIKNGGPPKSAGVYLSATDTIMVPLSSLGVKKYGSNYKYDYKGSNDTLPHEIAHQLTNLEYFSPGADGWFSEGLAEYIALTNYRGGKFMINSNKTTIVQTITGFNRKTGMGSNLGKKLKAPDLKRFMTMSYGQFTANANLNYGLGALITYYFFHFEKNGRTNINNFLMALNEGKQGEAALQSLLNGRSFDELEKQITKAWRSRGVEIIFK